MARHQDQEDHSDQPDEPGWALTRLISVHDGMRADLARLRGSLLAATKQEQKHGQEQEQERRRAAPFLDPAWSLHMYCARFCGFVHDHHSVEDTMLFPVLLRGLPDGDQVLGRVIERLAADHRVLAGHLDDMERALTAARDGGEAGAAAVEALDRLSEQLEAHLAFEEESLAPALNALSTVVDEDDLLPPDGVADPVDGSIGFVNGTVRPDAHPDPGAGS